MTMIKTIKKLLGEHMLLAEQTREAIDNRSHDLKRAIKKKVNAPSLFNVEDLRHVRNPR